MREALSSELPGLPDDGFDELLESVSGSADFVVDDDYEFEFGNGAVLIFQSSPCLTSVHSEVGTDSGSETSAPVFVIAT